jgi:purine-nucleoside phosphorylase
MMDLESHRRQVEGAVSFLSTKLPVLPEIAIVLGTGLSRLADSLEQPEIIPYADIPHFPVSTVTGHDGNLACGRIGEKNVAIHCYEGYSAREVAFPIRVLSLLGATYGPHHQCRGGLNPTFRPGNRHDP